jgi:hypothetical protein
MALLAVLTGGEGFFSVVTGAAVFSLSEGFHGQSVAYIGTSCFFLKQRVVAVATTYARTFMSIMIERYRSEAFGVFEHDLSGHVIRLNRLKDPTPQQTDRNEDRHTENPLPNFHRTPFSNNDLLKSNPLYPAPGLSLI